jgi:predicted alpha/beta-hydrolase family hydrolase
MSLKAVGAMAYPAPDPPEALLVLAHGAGAGQTHPFMVAVAQGLARRGVSVVTFDFPYMRLGRRVPDKTPVLEESFREALAAAREAMPGAPLFIGGKSMGGRMATHLAATGIAGLAGVAALGYPLHPPGRPDQLRVAHLPSVTVPVLIVQGERDAFGTPGELEPVIDAMRTAVTLHVVGGGDHSLGVRGRPRDQTLDPVLDAVVKWMKTSGVRGG